MCIAAEVSDESYVISDMPNNCTICVGKRQGVEVGARGVITRDGKEIAKYKVTQVGWLYSTIQVSDLVKGELVRVGDKAPLTSTQPAPGEKKVKRSSSGLVWALVAAGAILVLAGGKGGHSSTPSTPANGAVVVTTQKSSISADGTSTTTITATVTAAGGVPAADGTAVVFATTAGTVVPAQATTVGGVATTTLTSGASAATAAVTATSGGKTGSVNVTFVAGSAGSATITLAAGPSTIQVVGSGGAQTQSTITATCRDGLGNLATGGTVAFTSSIGSIIGTAAIGANGIATTTFSSATIGTATVTAQWSGAQDTVEVDITPGPPHTVTVECTPAAIQLDANSFAAVKATVRDIAGNPVTDGTTVNFSVQPDNQGGGNGSITPTAQTTAGVANALLFSKTIAGVLSNAGTATVAVQVPVGQPVGVPSPTTQLDNHATQVQFISLDVAEIHVGASPLNVRGWDVVNNTSEITVIAYDTNHNPVPDGTAVYFTTDHGMIYGTSGTAGRVTMSVTSSGRAGASLVTDASGDGTWDGHVLVTATSGTASNGGYVIFSGPPYPPNCSAVIQPETPLAPVGGQATIRVVAHDLNGNPVVDDTAVTAVTTKGSIDSSVKTIGGVATFTLRMSTSAESPTQSGPGLVTINIDSGGPNPATGGGPVTLTVDFTVDTP